ncbi:low affinity immunoglobulin epsilon Fc receptor-like [Crassostrea angulata]|uniref:low affinity immunoglobulin epsilon Fc receptor-like n=1 Tax=Magallana angulata TaxID=2784310 RepID=UPI0022B09C88|nr:low affinity immunoglobulin epsilon Fc receptor-like [Crassostrea angulata]
MCSYMVEMESAVEAEWIAKTFIDKGCENGWLEFGGHCYILLETKFPWAEARMECQKMCSYLVETESTMEAEWIGKTFLDKASCGANPYDCTAWTGLNDLDIEGQYRWDHSNTPLNFSNWYPGQPSLERPDQALDRDCIDMFRNGAWNDRFCSFLNLVICEKSFIYEF